jgi:predicted kinase
MAVYLCRWENGDFSVIQANNKGHALEMLDEVANAEGLPLYAITDFMVHFRLTDEGMLELEGFGERFGDHVRERVHPVLGELDVSPYDATPEDRARIKTAVQLERDSLKAGPAPVPDTELGKRIKSQMDLPTSVVNRQIRSSARKVLREAKPTGKPN